MQSVFKLVLGVTACLLALGASAQEPAIPTYTPAQTRVAVVPTVNLSGEKDAKQRAEQEERGTEETARRLAQRGFVVMDAAEVSRAITDLKIDLTDEEYHNRATLLRIGKAAGADLVAFSVINSVDQRRVKTPIFDGHRLEGRANTKTWLLDVRTEMPLVNGVRREGQSHREVFAEFDGGSRHIKNAVGTAIADALKPFLERYPAIKPGK